MPTSNLGLQTPGDMGHIMQINSLKTHGHEELQLSSITATDLQMAQITGAQIDCRANTRFRT